MEKEVKEHLIELIIDYLHLNEEEIRFDIPYTELGIDSLDFAEIIHGIERNFDISIPDSEFTENIKTLNDVTFLIINIINNKNGQ